MIREKLKLHHGTPHAIHLSSRPFLDPALAKGRDDGDLPTPNIMATSDKRAARIFAFKDPNARSRLITTEGDVLVYSTAAPQADTQGWIFEIPSEGFTPVKRGGKAVEYWVCSAENMPFVTDVDGKQVRGISLKDVPVHQVIMRDLVQKDGMMIFLLTNRIATTIYTKVARQAVASGKEDNFVKEAVRRGWIKNITKEYQ